jgi:hypothetical protein
MKTKSFTMRTSVSLLLCILLANIAGATSYTLTLTAQGSGVIYRNPTNTSYPSGVTVTITGTPNDGWYFANWSGDVNSTVNPLNVTMNSNLNITGNFLQYPTYNLALATNGQGAIALSPGGGSYLSNTVVQATATAANGWVFAGWSGATVSSTNPVSFAVDSNGTLTGTFAQLPAFNLQPVSVTNKAGGSANFVANAIGTGPLSYQWFFNGSLLAGETSPMLSLANVSNSQVGNYWVVATNYYGSATSLVASLTLTNNSIGPTNVVTSANEASLQAAIAQGGWVGIEFNETLTLTNTIVITNNVILDGTGFGAVISGGNAVQLFHVTNGASLTLSNLTLANANYPYGAAVDIDAGAVTVVDCLFTNNQSFWGGCFYNNDGSLTLLGSAFSNNIVTGSGCLGGVVYQAVGSMLVSNCIFSFNSATNTGSGALPVVGGAMELKAGNATINQSQFFGNTASGLGAPGVNSGCPAAGGAIYSTATLTVNDSSFAGNLAVADNRVDLRSPGKANANGAI